MTRRRETVVPVVRKAPVLKLVPIASASDVDLGRVAKAKHRIATGWYDRSEVRDRLVEAMLHEMYGR